MDLVTYLGFDGCCEEAFKHYEAVLGGKLLMMVRNGDAPPGTPIAPGSEHRIMHARLQVGERLLMGGDGPLGHAFKPTGFSVNIMTDDVAEAERIFRGLTAGGKVSMPIGETFWARRFGMLVDRFGTPWMVNCEKAPGAAETPSSKPFSLSRTFKATRETLWDAFTDSARMQAWWGPKGVDIVHSKMDLRPGGIHHYGMRTSDGKTMWGRQVYREIDRPSRLVFVNSFSDSEGGLGRHPLAPQWPIELLSTLTFSDAGPGTSTLRVDWTPIYPTPEELRTFEAGHESMQQGWTGTLDKLDSYLKGERAG